VSRPVWATSLSCSHDCLDETLPSDEAIIEVMKGSDKPWDDMHHRSYFLPELERIEQDDFRSTLSEVVGHAVVPMEMTILHQPPTSEHSSKLLTDVNFKRMTARRGGPFFLTTSQSVCQGE
jgi:hypothetical protein